MANIEIIIQTNNQKILTRKKQNESHCNSEDQNWPYTECRKADLRTQDQI